MNPNTSGSTVQSNKGNSFGIKVSNPGINVLNATDAQLQYLNNYSQEIFYANGAANVLIGARPANSQNGLLSAQEGFFVAKPGIDVRTATNAQMAFNSNTGLSTIISGVYTFPPIFIPAFSTGIFQTTTIAHGVGFLPTFTTQALERDYSTAYQYNSVITSVPSYPVTSSYIDTAGPAFASEMGIAYAFLNSVDATNLYLYIRYQDNVDIDVTIEAIDVVYGVYASATAP